MAIKSNHCAYDTHYHIVFPVKYRKALLANNIPLAISEIAKEIGLRYEIDFEKIGCDTDHLHILASYHPKYSGTEIVTKIKSLMARELFKRFPELRKELWGGEFWSDGYYIATVGERGNWNIIKKYIENQGKTVEQSQLRLLI